MLPWTPGDAARLRRAYRLVRRVRDACPEPLRRSIPEQALVALPGGRMVVVEEYLPGVSLARRMAERRNGPRAGELLAPASAWLTEFSRATLMKVAERTIRAGRRLVDREVGEFRSAFRLDPPEDEFLERVRRSCADWLAAGGALVPLHGDFEPGNVLLSTTGIGILDWGFGRPVGLPGHDLLFLLLRFFTRAAGLSRLQSSGEEYREMVEQVFWADTWQSRLARGTLQRYWRQLELPPAGLDAVLGIFLVTTANAYYRYLSDRAEWGWLFLPRSDEGLSFREALREIAYVQLFRHLADRRRALLWDRLG
jgi:aminoglycoside phosphotransferase (APT) family kinase protein